MLSCLIPFFYVLQHSWKWFIYTRTQNVNKGARSHLGPSKKKRKVESIDRHAFPKIAKDAEDEISYERHMKRLEEEMDKPRPSTSVLKDLMARTTKHRSFWIRDTTDTPTLQEVFSKAPLLKKSAYVSFASFFPV